jgi:BirA family transcriptional regulator, biotin operon repressor / biotin---[acetyl-CoA-carboxylase] ligase
METLFIGKNTIFLPQTESTNSYAIQLLKNVNLAEGTVVHTAHQTAGKGQRGNVWKADALSNLIISIILKPTFLELKNQFFLYQVIALGCYDTMAELLDDSQFDIKIKWPNDILVNNKKIAGILIENSIVNSTVNWSVAGVGMNVNQESFPGLAAATSLKMLTSRVFAIQVVMQMLCRYVEKWYLLLKKNNHEQVRSAYLERLFGLSTTMPFEVGEEVRHLFVKGVSARGLLHLRDEKGQEFEADVKQLKWIY